ncbi:hypothetical protein BLOT_006434 [Blomia tropicalis]|nr:hypothetical protein BLOT_006434 [Blomia tropicalis]
MIDAINNDGFQSPKGFAQLFSLFVCACVYVCVCVGQLAILTHTRSNTWSTNAFQFQQQQQQQQEQPIPVWIQKKGTFGQWEPIKMCSAYRRTPSWLNLMGPEYAAFYNA